MAVNRDKFFAELDGLTEKEIEARLSLFDDEQLSLLQEYVDEKTLEQVKAALQGAFETSHTTKTAMAALRAAQSANSKAVAALILSVGAMLTAVMCGVIVVMRY